MEYQFRPLDRWPHPPTKKRRSQWTFKAKWNDTLSLLGQELRFLGAQRVVLQAVIDVRQIRLDGMLRAGASPSHPGIVLSFDSQSAGSLSFPCDSCDFWQHNVRSIALGLQALRAVDRYGVTKRAEQYKGWERLPSPSGDGAIWKVPQSIGEARELVAKLCDPTGHDDKSLAAAAVKERLKHHPDRGGDGRMFRALNAAVQLLKQ